MEKKEPKSPAFERIRAINREVSYKGKTLSQDDLTQYLPARLISASGREDALSILCDTLEKPITSDMVERLVRLNVSRPAWIEVQQWESLAPITEEEKIIVMLSAFGMTEDEIGKELKMKTSAVKHYLSYKRNQEKFTNYKRSTS
jgi:DNA-binding NarL/FixJ family response regulator